VGTRVAVRVRFRLHSTGTSTSRRGERRAAGDDMIREVPDVADRAAAP
jgi:hypothetical protein